MNSLHEFQSESKRLLFATVRTLLAIQFLLLVASRANAVPFTYQTLHTWGEFDGSPSRGLTLQGSTLYGTTIQGGEFYDGTIFSLGVDGANFKVLHSFDSTAGLYPSEGYSPNGVIAIGSTLYGTTGAGGAVSKQQPTGFGVIYSISTDGTDYQVSHWLTAADGMNPGARLTQLGSTLFGMTGFSGPSGGNLFSFDVDTWEYQVKATLPFDAASSGRLINVGDRLYGTSQTTTGRVYSVNLDGTDFQVLHRFQAGDPSDGKAPRGDLVSIGSTLFGTTTQGGPNGVGTVYSIEADGSNYQILHSFESSSASNGIALTVVGDMLYGTAQSSGPNHDAVMFSMNPDGSNFRTLYTFGATALRPVGTFLVNDGSTIYGNTSKSVFAFTVPEPSTLVLAVLGAMAITSLRVLPAACRRARR